MSQEYFREYFDGRIVVYGGDSRLVLRDVADESIDSCCCDPPYNLTSIAKRFGADDAAPAKSNGSTGVYKRASGGFMGSRWDSDVAMEPEIWAEVFRVLKPGGYILAFSGTRTYHRMATAIESVGFVTHPMLGRLVEMDDGVAEYLASQTPEQLEAFVKLMDRNDPVGGMLAWIFGSGFPSGAHNASRAIDQALGLKGDKAATGNTVRRIRPGADQNKDGTWTKLEDREYQPGSYIPVSDEAKQWEGWFYGAQALKPALEPIYMGQKPYSKAGPARSIMTHGVGAVNVDGCRIPAGGDPLGGGGANETRRDQKHEGYGRPWMDDPEARAAHADRVKENVAKAEALGRWPANVVHDGSDEVVSCFPESDARSGEPREKRGKRGVVYGAGLESGGMRVEHGDNGSAARFFFSTKADSEDRAGSRHPTIKPVPLMRWLVRLVTPPNGLTLDPFAGSGSTGEAAYHEGMRCIMIEQEPKYLADIDRRMSYIFGGPEERAREFLKARGDVKPPDDLPLFAGANSTPTEK